MSETKYMSKLGAGQITKWENYSDPSREWPTPVCIDSVREALQKPNVPQRILVVGCGSGRDVDGYAKEFPDAEIVGIDINEASLQLARERVEEPKVSFIHANILDDADIEMLMRESFGVVTFVGLLTNLVTTYDAFIALENAGRLLSVNGSLIISDYSRRPLFPEDKIFWSARYRRDAAALSTISHRPANELYGAFVVRPRGLPAKRTLQLSEEDILECLEKGDYERLARHWDPEHIQNLLSVSEFTWDMREPVERIILEMLSYIDTRYNFEMVATKTGRSEHVGVREILDH